MLRVERIAVTTAGVAGSASGNTDSGQISGKILGLAVNFDAAAPATTDITIDARVPGGPQFTYNLWVRNNSAADAYVAPRATPVDNANTAITNAHDHFVVQGTIRVALAQSDAITDAVVVHVFYDDMQ